VNADSGCPRLPRLPFSPEPRLPFSPEPFSPFSPEPSFSISPAGAEERLCPSAI